MTSRVSFLLSLILFNIKIPKQQLIVHAIYYYDYDQSKIEYIMY